jgi:hypothetical protein
MFGNEVRRVSLDVVSASGVGTFAGFGADDFYFYGLAYVYFRKQAARIDAAESWPAICIRRGQVIQSDLMNFLLYAVRDIPNARDADGTKNENHNEKNQKNFDESAAGLGRSSGRRSGLRRGLRRCLRARGAGRWCRG